MLTSKELLKKIKLELELAVASAKSADEIEVYQRTLENLCEAESGEIIKNYNMK